MHKRIYNIILLGIMLCIAVFKANAQQNVLELDDASSPCGYYMARDRVVMKPGYSTKATDYSNPSCNMHIVTINDNITTQLDPDNYNPIIENTPNTYELNKSLEVGSCAGSFNVSLDGSANYQIPIIIPPGTAGFQPSVSVGYSSNGGDGIMGVGWNLGALSSINRVQKNLFLDNVNDGIKLDNTDMLAMDGSRLVMGTDGYYHTQVESFSRISVTESDANGPLRYLVETKDGLRIEYGSTGNSRILHSDGSGKVIAWYISKVSDRNGNYYSYYYTNNPSTGEFRVQRIDYTGNSAANITPYNSIHFVYDLKPAAYITPRYFLGSVMANNVLLTQIKVYAENTLMHKYVFNYATQVGGQNLEFIYLSDVQEFAEDKSYNKTIFNYRAQYSTGPIMLCDDCHNADEGTAVNVNTALTPFFGDFNGDGKLDKAYIKKECRTDYPNPENNCGYEHLDVLYDYKVCVQYPQQGFVCTNDLLTGISDHYSAQFLVNPNGYYTLNSADINGDGRDDAVFCSSRISSGNTNTRILQIFPLLSVPLSGSSYQWEFYPLPHIQKSFNDGLNYEVFVNDMDNDGLADLVVNINGELQIYYSDVNTPFQEGTNPVPVYNNNLGGGLPFHILDYNGDNLPDIMAKFLLPSQYEKIYQATSQRGVYTEMTLASGYMTSKKYCADFNNDGNSDIFIPDNGNGTGKIYFSKGDGTFVEKTIDLPNNNLLKNPMSGDPYYIGDFNGDGKCDISYAIGRDDLWEGHGNNVGYFCFCFNENFFSNQYIYQEHYNDCVTEVDPGNSTQDQLYTRLLYVLAVDKNGDGICDLYFKRLFEQYYYHPPANGNAGYWGWDYLESEDIISVGQKYPALMNKITDGVNTKTYINYGIGGMDTPPFPAQTTYPLSSRCMPFTVVKKVGISNGINSDVQGSYYSYYEPKFHLRGGGFLGFSKNVISTPITGFGNNATPQTTYAVSTKIFSFYDPITNPYYYPQLISEKQSYYVQTTNLSPIYNNDCFTNNPTAFNVFDVSETNYSYKIFVKDAQKKYFFPYQSQSNTSTHIYSVIDDSPKPTNQSNDLTNTGVSLSSNTTYTYAEDNNTEGYGNLLSVVSENGLLTTETEFFDYNTRGSWCPNKPGRQTVTTTRTGQTSHKVQTDYVWNTITGQLEQQKSPPGIGDVNNSVPAQTQEIITDYIYEIPGNVKKATTTGSDVTLPSWVTYEYDAKFRFAIKQTNSLQQTSEAVYEPRYGNVVYTKDLNGLETTYTYDVFGRNKTVNSPDGQVVNNTVWWTGGGINGKNENSLYYVKTDVTTGGSTSHPVYEFFDKLGRSVGTLSYAYGNTQIYTTTYYDGFGNAVQSRQPGPNNNRVVAQASYDAFGRNTQSGTLSVSNGSGDPATLQYVSGPFTSEITNSFDNSTTDEFKTITTDLNNRYVEKTYDKSGTLKRSTDISLGNTPNTVEYTYNSSNQPLTITTDGNVTTIVYDKYNRQYQLIDPDAGTSSYKYNAFNQITEQTDGKGNTYVMVYDVLGRLKQKKETPAGTSTVNTYHFTYDIEANGKGMLASMSGGPNNLTVNYKYDNLSRNYQMTETMDGQSFVTKYGFDNHSRVNKITYPSGFVIHQGYDNLTHTLTQITDDNNQLIWQLSLINQDGSIKQTHLGSGGQFFKEYIVTDMGLPDKILFTANFGAKTLVNEWKYNYDPITGNMLWRQNKLTAAGYTTLSNRNLTETFGYDEKDRLESISSHLFNNSPQLITYNTNGGIQSKTDALNNVQTYDYGSGATATPVHAVKNISPLFETYQPLQKIDYTPFNKIQQLIAGDKNPNNPDEVDMNGNYSQLNYWYGLDNERRKMTETTRLNGQLITRSKYYSLNYEKESTTANGTTTLREINYIFAPDGLAAIYEMKNNSGNYYYISSDVQGSINMVIDGANGNVESDMSYDAWGRRRNAHDWSYSNISRSSITDRGYTLHEMLDKFDLINMNGRAYDPLLAQFLSPDPFVQSPETPQSYNRYAYCFNNPLKYTDPSGYSSTDGFDWNWFIEQNSQWIESDFRHTMNNIEYGFTSGCSREAYNAWNKLSNWANWVNTWDRMYNSYQPDVYNVGNVRDETRQIWSDYSGFYDMYGKRPDDRFIRSSYVVGKLGETGEEPNYIIFKNQHKAYKYMWDRYLENGKEQYALICEGGRVIVNSDKYATDDQASSKGLNSVIRVNHQAWLIIKLKAKPLRIYGVIHTHPVWGKTKLSYDYQPEGSDALSAMYWGGVPLIAFGGKDYGADAWYHRNSDNSKDGELVKMSAVQKLSVDDLISSNGFDLYNYLKNYKYIFK